MRKKKASRIFMRLRGKTILLTFLAIVIYFIFPNFVYSQMLHVPFLSQRDNRWADDTLGSCAGCTIESDGCATSSKAMVFNYFYPNYTDPGQLNTCLLNNNGYAYNSQDCPGNCLIPWDDKNNNCAPSGVSFAGHFTDNLFARIDSELLHGYPVIAKVNSTNIDMHFVVITGKSGSAYYINDPYDLNYEGRTLNNGSFGDYEIDAIWLFRGTVKIPLSGDCDGDGRDNFAYFENSFFHLADGHTILFGQPGDYPIIGDWDGDGADDIGVFRAKEEGAEQSTFYLELLNDGELGGSADYSIPFGYWPTDIPVVGDWDGDGDDDIGGYNPANSTFYLYLIDLTTSNASSYIVVPFGQIYDYPVIGDWDCDGDDDIGVFRIRDPNENTNNFYFDINLTGDQAEYNVTDFGSNGYGIVGDLPVIGNWDGDGDDNIGVYRPSDPGSAYDKFYANPSIPNICTQHTVSVPNTPSGPSDGYISIFYAYTAGGSSCSQGHDVEYRFDWGDGTYSNWSSSTSDSHSWSNANTYTVKSQARCSDNTSIVSEWSPGMTVTISTYPQEEGTFTGYLDQDNTSKTHSITLPNDGELKFKITYDSTLDISGPYWGVIIYDTNETLLFGVSSPSSGVDYGPYGLKAGTYYIRILRRSGYGGYTLTTIYDVQAIANDTEPNDQFSDANEAPLNGGVTGHLGYKGGGDGTTDTLDIFTTALDGDGELKFKITYDSTLDISGPYWGVIIYDTNETLLFGVSSPSSGVDYGPYGLKAGTYYIRILRRSGYGGYTLTTIYDVQAIANDTEPNDQFSDANEAQLNESVTGHLGYKGGGDGTTDTLDIFTTALDGDGELKFNIIYDSTLDISGYYRGIELYDTSETLLFAERSPSSGVDYGPYGLKAGTYYIKILRDSGYGGYTLTLFHPETGSLRVTLSPQEALEAGAKWRVDGREWQDSGATVTELSIGEHEVEYKAIAGWNAPADDETVTIVEGQTTQLTRTYTIIQTGNLKVTLDPEEAVNAGAKWNVDEGGWQDSGATVTGLNVGEHTVNYKSISNWIAPQSETATINYNQTTQLTRTYTQPQNIYLSLDPTIGTSGNNITMSVEISDNNQEIGAFGLELTYDSSFFVFKEVGKGSLTSDWSSVEENEIESGKIKIEGYAGGGTIVFPYSNGSLAEIKLQVKCLDYNEETEIQLKIENYTDGIAGFLPHPCTTDFTFVPCPRLGDVNEDGELTPSDAQKAFEIYLAKLTPDFCQDTTSDANCSGNTTPGDAQEIFKHFLGKIILPECCAEVAGSSAIPPVKRVADEKSLKPDKPVLYPLNTIGSSGELVKVPIIIANPEGISSFSFEVNYDHELLEYIGLNKSTLTNEFDYVRGIKEVEGLVRVMGESKKPIKNKNHGSLAVMVFRVKERINVSLPIFVFNLGKDLSRVETREGTFIGLDYFKRETRYLNLGEAIIMADGTLRIPVKVSSAFNMKSFGLELKYSKEKMLFTGINRGALTENFIALEGNEIEPGVVRVGGYSMSEIQERDPGVLVELVFYMRETGGDVEIVKLFDDIQDFIIQKGNIRLDKQNN